MARAPSLAREARALPGSNRAFGAEQSTSDEPRGVRPAHAGGGHRPPLQGSGSKRLEILDEGVLFFR